MGGGLLCASGVDWTENEKKSVPTHGAMERSRTRMQSTPSARHPGASSANEDELLDRKRKVTFHFCSLKNDSTSTALLTFPSPYVSYQVCDELPASIRTDFSRRNLLFRSSWSTNDGDDTVHDRHTEGDSDDHSWRHACNAIVNTSTSGQREHSQNVPFNLLAS